MASYVGPDDHPIAELPDALSQMLGILADRNRLRVLFALTAGERSVTDLWRSLGLSQPIVSHHLGVLRASGLATGRRDGKSVYYSLGPCARARTEPSVIDIDCLQFGVTLSVRRDGSLTAESD